MGVQRDWQRVCEMATGVKRGDCDSRFTSFGWGVAVRFIWVRESSPQEENLESTWARDLLFTGGSRGANALREDITQVFVSITKQTVVYPLWFSEGKIQLMLKPGSFSSENQRPIYNLLELDSPKGEFYRLLLLIVLHENAKFTKTDTQLPIDPDPWTSLILHWDDPNLRSTVYMKTVFMLNALFFPQDKRYSVLRFFSWYFSLT